MRELLRIEDLTLDFYSYEGINRILDGVNLTIEFNQWLGLVGETGSGKSMTAFSILKLIPSGAVISRGKIIFKGENLLEKTEEELRKIRGSRISMIFQDPMASLNPAFRIGDQIIETIMLYHKINKKEARKKAAQLLELVQIPSPWEKLKAFPHELSGGMQQRVMIAMALCYHPDLIIADEPTTSLDVTTQAEILDLMKELQKNFKNSVLLITHNLAIVVETCSKVAVMYGGKIVEYADIDIFFNKKNYLHPYTQELINAIPTVEEKKKIKSADGEELPFNPFLINYSGCRFYSRCPYKKKVCKEQKPPEIEVKKGHTIACHLFK